MKAANSISTLLNSVQHVNYSYTTVQTTLKTWYFLKIIAQSTAIESVTPMKSASKYEPSTRFILNIGAQQEWIITRLMVVKKSIEQTDCFYD